MTTMRERIARAIHDNENTTPWDARGEVTHRHYLEAADAALAALEEPTENMLWAAISRPIAPQASVSDLHRLLFRAMIRAAGE